METTGPTGLPAWAYPMASRRPHTQSVHQRGHREASSSSTCDQCSGLPEASAWEGHPGISVESFMAGHQLSN